MDRLALLPGAGLLFTLASACAATPTVAPTPSTHDVAARPAPAPSAPSSPAAPRALVPPEAARASGSPAFPEGWVRGAAAMPLEPAPAPSPRSLRALAALRSPQRLPVPALTALSLADLPVIDVAPEPEWSKEPTAAPGPEGAPDLFFDWRPSGASSRERAFAAGGGAGASVAIEVRGQRFGYFDLNFYSSFTLPDTPGGLQATCGTVGGTGYRSASWESLTPAEGGQVHVEGAEAWFDYHTCRVYVARRFDVLARPFADGLAYAFRTRCPSCADHAEELHLVLPEQGWSSDNRRSGFHTEHAGSPHSHLSISLGPGSAGSIGTRLSASAIERFKKLGAAPLGRSKAAIFGMELTRGAAEVEATALFYVIDAPGE
jgi:hypothetical protein